MGTALDDSVGLTQPRTPPELLRMWGVNGKPYAEQWHPIMVWLEYNKPSRDLWIGLLDNGYGHHLEQAIPAFDRPVARRRITATSGTQTNLLLL